MQTFLFFLSLTHKHNHHEHRMHLKFEFGNQNWIKLNIACFDGMFHWNFLHSLTVIWQIILWKRRIVHQFNHAEKWGITCGAHLATQVRPPILSIEKPIESTNKLSHSLSHTHSLSCSSSLSLYTLTDLVQGEAREDVGEGLEAALTSKEPWPFSRSRSPQEVWDRRGWSPLSLIALELGGGGASKERSSSCQHQDPASPSYWGAQHQPQLLLVCLNRSQHQFLVHFAIHLEYYPMT